MHRTKNISPLRIQKNRPSFFKLWLILKKIYILLWFFRNITINLIWFYQICQWTSGTLQNLIKNLELGRKNVLHKCGTTRLFILNKCGTRQVKYDLLVLFFASISVLISLFLLKGAPKLSFMMISKVSLLTKNPWKNYVVTVSHRMRMSTQLTGGNKTRGQWDQETGLGLG